ncbi:hypothetical protein ABIA33_007614, partial [Streptacidiphilus sp. MAP12-16]|uniref:UBP-type zinc finger domain-containing protein n=1 Tax=Streptacidiphilus sp. MAP12-16 TaxID=3156300 RepID=UPI0035141E41
RCLGPVKQAMGDAKVTDNDIDEVILVGGSTRTCGHVGCCDASPMRHGRGHAATVGHPIVQSFESGEDWRWCYVHEAMV